MKITFKLELVLSVLLVIIFSTCEGLKSQRGKNQHRLSASAACPIPIFKNGTFRLQRAGRMGYFYCSPGFEIHGAMSILCNSGRWKQDIPICMKPGCKIPQKRENGFVMTDEKKQKVLLFCQDGYISSGSTIAFCDGVKWDRELGECRKDVGYTKMCDFETSTLCGWTQDTENDFFWARRNGWTSYEKFEFGPKHDHTKGKPLDGFYMIAEATNSRPSQRSRLLSPVHKQNDSESACFRFYYHMYGQNVGRLKVIVKSINEEMDDVVDNPVKILFEKSGNLGNQWNEEIVQIEPTDADFQIIFEATGSKGTINDIAIDDVALMNGGDCIKYLKLDVVTEETGGIYDSQSCANRCMETESSRTSGNETFIKIENGTSRIIERCDCHQECEDLSTCCLDYKMYCFDSQSTDSDDITPTDVVVSERVPTATTVAKTLLATTQKPNSTSTLMPTTVPILTSTKASISKNMTSNSTSTIMTTTVNTKSNITTIKNIIFKTIPVIILNTSTVKSINTITIKPFIITKIPGKAPVILTNATKIPQKFPEKTTVSVKITTTTPKNMPITTPKNVLITTIPTTSKKTTTMKLIINTTQPTKSTLITSKSTIKTTQVIKSITSTSIKKNIYFAPSKPTAKISTSTDTTLNAMLLPTDKEITRIQFIWITTVILICILSALTLIAWKRFSGKKWNQFNSNPIEYKSNYNSDNDEPAVRSNSFIIDDSFNATLIDDDDIDENTKSNKIKSEEKVKNIPMEKVKNNTNGTSITKKASDRLRKNCDQYSERRCLTSDDEQFDFSMQTNE